MKRAIFAAILMTVATALHADTDIPTSLNAVNDEFNEAVAAGDAKRLVNLYSDDTLWVAQGMPVTQGLEGPRQLFKLVTQNQGKVTHTIEYLFVSDDETLAVMIGSIDAEIESQDLDTSGTYLFVLKPDDGGWKIITDMWHQHSEQ